MRDDDKPELHSPASRSRPEYEAELKSGDPDRVGLALIDSSYIEDAAWVQARSLEGLASPHAAVRWRAVIALQVLANLRGEIDPLTAVPVLTMLLHDPDSTVSWLAGEALGDIKRIFRQ